MGIEVALLAAGTALAAGSAIYGGISANQQAKTQAELASRQAAQERDAAVAQAEKIRRSAQRQKASANAGLAASGVSLGSGTALRISNEIDRMAEQDAYQTILSGNRAYASGQAEAGMLRTSGSNALTGGFLNAGSSLLSGAAQTYKAGWKAGAPVVERSSYIGRIQ